MRRRPRIRQEIIKLGALPSLLAGPSETQERFAGVSLRNNNADEGNRAERDGSVELRSLSNRNLSDT